MDCNFFGDPDDLRLTIAALGTVLRFLPQRIARFCRQAVQDALPEREAGLLGGLLVGGTKRMSEDDLTAFRIAGLSHLTAVSGSNVAIVVGAVFFAMRRTRARRRRSAISR